MASLLRALWHLDGWRCHVFIGHLAENMAQAIQAGAALVIGLHGEPWGFRDMRLRKHGVLSFRVVHPAIMKFDVHRTHLPATLLVINAFLEMLLLFVIFDGEPVFHQQDSVLHQHLLKLWIGHIKLLQLFASCEAHNFFHAGPVVLAPVKDNDFSSTGEMLHIALEIPLAFLML